MPSKNVDVALYGDIARHGGGQLVAQLKVDLPADACVGDLLDKLGIADEARGYLFINAVLADMPGLSVARPEPLHDGDHVGIFSIKHMWPFQYRDGMPMTERLQAATRERGVLHHSYVSAPPKAK
jgi:hypothetical protein